MMLESVETASIYKGSIGTKQKKVLFQGLRKLGLKSFKA